MDPGGRSDYRPGRPDRDVDVQQRPRSDRHGPDHAQRVRGIRGRTRWPPEGDERELQQHRGLPQHRQGLDLRSDDPAAVWNTYMAQTTDDGSHFVQTTVSAHANHVGVICTFGTGCARGTRNLLDLFEVAINLQSGKAAIIFTDDTLTTYTRSDGTVAPLPQVIVAWES